MWITIYPSKLKRQIEELNNNLDTVISNADPLKTSISEFVGETELQGNAYKTQKEYMNEGHLPAINSQISIAQLFKDKNTAYNSYIDTYLGDSTYISEFLLQLQVDTLSNFRYGSDSIGLDSISSILESRINNCKTQLENMNTFVQLTSGLYSDITDQIISVKSKIASLENATYDSETQTYYLPVSITQSDSGLSDEDIKTLKESYGFTEDQSELILKAFKALEGNYKGNTKNEEYLNYVFGVLGPLCVNYNSKRFRMTANTLTLEDAKDELKKSGLSEQEITDLIVLINLQHSEYWTKDKFIQSGIDIDNSSFKDVDNKSFVDNSGKGYVKDFAHELIQYSVFSNKDNDINIKNFFKGDFRGGSWKGLVDIFNSNYINSYTKYEASFKGDIDSGRYGRDENGFDLEKDSTDFQSDIDAINIYERMKNGTNPFQSMLDYNREVNNGELNRAKKFFENMGDGHIGIGMLEMKEILEVETMGSDWIQSSKEVAEQGTQDFLQWIMTEYNKGENNEK